MRRRHRVILWSLLGSPLFIGGVLIAAFIWRKPLTESIIAAYLQRNYGIATELAIGEIGASEIRVDHVKLGDQAPFEARNVRIAYDLSGHISADEAAEISAHGKIEGGTVTLGDLEPLIAGGSDSTGGEAKLPEQIAIERLNFQLGTPLGDLTIGGKALLGKGALALDLTATDSGGHTKGAAKVDISDAMAQPTMSGEIRLTLEPGSALWGFAPEIAPTAGTVEASVILDHVAPMDGAAAGGNAAGPLGAIVGGAVGAATGTVGGILGVEARPRFREYVVRERRPSYTYQGDVRTGVVLPEAGVEYYDVPSEYRVPPGYRYTVVNGRPVLIESRTRRIVEIYE